jgi:hypothetical protein
MNEEKNAEGIVSDSKKVLDAIVLLKHKEGMDSKKEDVPKEGVNLTSIVQKLTRNHEKASKQK